MRRSLAPLQSQPMQGSGPAVAVTGPAPLGTLSVTVGAGALGVGLVDVALNGVTLLTGLASAATVPLTGPLAGTQLELGVGVYLGSAYTLVVT